MISKEQWVELKTSELVEEILAELEKAPASAIVMNYGYKINAIKAPLEHSIEQALIKKFADKGWTFYRSTDEGLFKNYALT